MSVQHHGSDEQSRLLDRFREQMNGQYVREFPSGRTGADDDGELTYAISTDDKHRTIVIKFAHPTEWIGLDVQSATDLRDQLTERLLALRGVTASMNSNQEMS